MTNTEVHVATLGYEAKLPIPSVEEVVEMFNPPPAPVLSDKCSGEIVAVGTAVYEGIKPAPYDSHKRLCAAMGAELGSNLWLLSSYPRLPYPYSVLYTIGGMFQTEKALGKKCDWLLWVDDDVVVRPDLFQRLRSVADPTDKPFVAAVACDRSPPFSVAIWSMFDNGKGLQYRKQWVAPDPADTPEDFRYKLRPDEMWMPESGVHEIAVTGLCAALFHRSLFDRVKQPWFAVAPGECSPDGKMCHKVNTDSWWCQQMENEGIKRYVNCDAQVIHLGFPMPVAPHTAPILRRVFSCHR